MDSDLLARALGVFAPLNPTHLYVHFVQVFLEVASADGPVTFRELEDALSLTNSAISRTVMALGQTNRRGDPGYDLLKVDADPEEGRRFIVTLTAKGRALKRQLDKLN